MSLPGTHASVCTRTYEHRQMDTTTVVIGYHRSNIVTAVFIGGLSGYSFLKPVCRFSDFGQQDFRYSAHTKAAAWILLNTDTPAVVITINCKRDLAAKWNTRGWSFYSQSTIQTAGVMYITVARQSNQQMAPTTQHAVRRSNCPTDKMAAVCRSLLTGQSISGSYISETVTACILRVLTVTFTN